MDNATNRSARPVGNLVEKVLAEITAPSILQPATTQQQSVSRALFRRRSKFRIIDKEHRELFDAAAEFAGALNYDKPRWLTMLGPSGVGKTMLAREVYRHFMDYSRFQLDFDAKKQQVIGNTGQFCDWRSFVKGIREGAFGRIDDLCSDWFVVLDDIGSEHDPSDFIASTLDRICNSRLGKWTLITSNLPFQQIAERLDTRIADRMLRHQSVVIETKLASYQLQHQQ